jgi:hypothetical protein
MTDGTMPRQPGCNVSGEPQRADVKAAAEVTFVSGSPQRADVTRRRWLWRAEYRDGSTLEEVDECGVEARFEDVRREELRRFSLVDARTRREVIAVDCATGVFTVRGRRLDFRLGDVALTGRAGVSYCDVVQYKTAHSDWREGQGASGTVVDAHHLGVRASLPEGAFEVVLRLDARSGRLGVEVTLSSPAAARAAEFGVSLDGVRIKDGTDIQADPEVA